MKKLLLAILILASLFACKSKTNTTMPEKKAMENNATVAENAKPALSELAGYALGSYTGLFGENTIALLVSHLKGDSVFGRTIVGGNDRPFAGTYAVNDTAVAISASEPGDNQYDGSFKFYISKNNSNKLFGVWKAFKPTATINEKEYELYRKKFEYNPNNGRYDASKRLLKAEDVENKGKYDLEYMRNEIFARHGYCFKKRDLRALFEMQDWYIPNTTNVADDLTKIERANIALIKKYEKYAEDYGDEFGR
jgi:hypothetical protein